MKKLTLKTFLLLLGLSLTISIFAYACIWFFLPYTNKNQAQRELHIKTEQLISELRLTPKAESENLFTEFIRQTGTEVFLLDHDNQTVSLFTFERIQTNPPEGNKYPFKFADSTDEYILVVHYNQSRSDEMLRAISGSIPFVAVITIILSFLCAWIFSRYTTRPIIRINKIADKMANLDFSWYCPDIRDDEIGMLSKSINELSDKLHVALDELHLRNSILEDEITFEKERERRRMLFFSGVSHELKTPIAVVIGQLEGMQAQIGVYKDRDKYLARSAEILQSLNNFIKEVLIVSHMDMMEQKETTPVNLSETIFSLIREYFEYAETDSIGLNENVESGVFVYGDELLLKKALGNIIGNAVTYSPDNGNIEITLVHKNKKATLTVINTPAHIDEEHLPHLFEAFYQVNQTSKHGSGLGLYITRMILDTYNISHYIENTEYGVKFTALFDEASI